MGENSHLTRRRVLCGISVATGSAVAGCSTGPLGGGSMTWEEAFVDGTSEGDRTLLARTPVVPAAVTSKTEVETALAVLGWNLSVDPISSDLLESLEASLSVAADLRPDMTAAVSVLEEGLDLVQKMKETSAAGTSVWDLAVASVPSLEQFVDLVRRVRGRLEEELGRLDRLEEATSGVVGHVRTISETAVTQYGDLPGNVTAAISIYESIVADIDGLREDVQEVIEISADARASATDLPVMGGQVASIFDAINGAANDVDARLGELGSSIDSISDGLDGALNRASAEANDRYGPISKKATGSTGEMDVTTISTDVEAYDPSAVSAPDTPTETEQRQADVTPVDESAVTPGDYVTKSGSSSRGRFEFTVPTTVRSGEQFMIEGRITEEYPEQYGGFKVYIDGRQVASEGVGAGETVRVQFSHEYREQGRKQLEIEVRFTNSDHGVDELVGHASFSIRVVE